MTDALPFDVCGPLPSGVTVLEASAGTGKTFTIAALAARYVAEGVPLDQLLMVTFTRMATSELRERVRERLVDAEHGLERALAGAPPESDELVLLLASRHRGRGPARRELLARALAKFDSATIATTHGFCQEVLGGLGVVGDVEADTTFLEDISDLRQEVVEDLYVRRFHRHGSPQFSLAEAMNIASVAIDNPAAPIEPATAPENSIAAMRVRLATAAREELDTRKRRMAVMTYDDLLDPAEGHARRPGWPERGRSPPRPLQRRPGRRVPGHRPDPVGDHGDRVRARRRHARADRRSQAGDLRLPRRRRLRLHPGRPHRRRTGHTAHELAQRPRAARRL